MGHSSPSPALGNSKAKYLAENKIYFNFFYTVQHAPFGKESYFEKETVEKLLKGPITESFPASILHNHQDVTVIIDEDAYQNMK